MTEDARHLDGIFLLDESPRENETRRFVDFESARRVVRAISPVPGGVGPVTNAILLTHLVRAARNLRPLPEPVAKGETR